MALRFRKVYPHLWNDERFITLDTAGKLIAVNILTGPHSNRVGIFSLSVAAVAEQCGMLSEWSGAPPGHGGGHGVRHHQDTKNAPTAHPQSFPDRLASVCQSMGWRWDAKARVVYIPSWWKFNAPDNASAFIGYLGDLDELPQTQLIKEFASNTRYLTDGFRKILVDRLGHHLDTVSDTLVTPCQVGVPHQEKEKEKEKETKSCPEPGSPASGPLAVIEPPVMTFPTKGIAREWHLTATKLVEYRQSFPGLDVEGELRKALQWLRDSPNRQKTAQGMPRFLGGWLGRANDRGPPAGRSSFGPTTRGQAQDAYTLEILGAAQGSPNAGREQPDAIEGGQ